MDDDGEKANDTRLDALSRGVDDVRDEMNAGLAEVRQLVEQSRESVFRMESALAGSGLGASLKVVECIDDVRVIAERTRRQQGALIGVVTIQAVLLAIAIALIVMMRTDVQRGPLISSDITAEKAQTLSAVVAEPRLVTSPPQHVDASITAQPTAVSDSHKPRRSKRHH